MSNKVSGIKSVDFKITASGYGVVNWNGPTTLQSDGRSFDNHTMPKLRGYSNLTGKESERGYKLKKDPSEISFKETPMYISQNCIRHHLFRDHAFDLHYANDKNLIDVLGVDNRINSRVCCPCKPMQTYQSIIDHRLY